MRIGIIGPSKLRDGELVSKVAKMIAGLGHEIVLTADKGSTSEFFANEYLKVGGKKVYSVIPEDDTEFGNSWVERIGEIINCSTWRNQPENLNEETDCLVSIGYSSGGMIEICYSKWFNKKPVYILKEFISENLPEELESSLDLNYLGIDELKEILTRS
jgi:hypothetical protein